MGTRVLGDDVPHLRFRDFEPFHDEINTILRAKCENLIMAMRSTLQEMNEMWTSKYADFNVQVISRVEGVDIWNERFAILYSENCFITDLNEDGVFLDYQGLRTLESEALVAPDVIRDLILAKPSTRVQKYIRY